ncbi:mitochondrial intermembrane space protein Mia40 [Xylariales sp. AK1849]|nr:mitochondrial intermembrane space protein Mia40 [Xylariales sp. AK1849]
MYRTALRSTPRAAHSLRHTALRATTPRRFASTSPADKKRSWKSSALRWGLAIGAVYWYSTSPAFAEEPQLQHVQAPPQFSDDDLPTVEAVVKQKRREAEARLAKAAASREEAKAVEAAAAAPSAAPPAQDTETSAPGPGDAIAGPEALEAEADRQGAFNPETGEINWDCPCLGGMADGPCGEDFKAAFSCFVYSEEEPKGMDCIDKFQHMQDCFRKHPEIYGAELADDEEEIPADAMTDAAPSDAKTVATEGSSDTTPNTSNPAASDAKSPAKPISSGGQLPERTSELKPASTPETS